MSVCCNGNQDEACGWPRKTVRATIALVSIPIIITGSIVLMILLFWRGKYSSALGVLSGLTGILGTIIGYYFGSRSAENSKIISEINV